VRLHRFASPAEWRQPYAVRATPLACRAGNVKILRGAWNEELFRILEGFPDLAHDDEVDASSGALKMLNHQMKSWASKNFIGNKPSSCASKREAHEATAEGSNPSPFRWEPTVRIHFPPPASHVRT